MNYKVAIIQLFSRFLFTSSKEDIEIIGFYFIFTYKRDIEDFLILKLKKHLFYLIWTNWKCSFSYLLEEESRNENKIFRKPKLFIYYNSEYILIWILIFSNVFPAVTIDKNDGNQERKALCSVWIFDHYWELEKIYLMIEFNLFSELDWSLFKMELSTNISSIF